MSNDCHPELIPTIPNERNLRPVSAIVAPVPFGEWPYPSSVSAQRFSQRIHSMPSDQEPYGLVQAASAELLT